MKEVLGKEDIFRFEELNKAIEEYIDHVRFDIPDYIAEKINDCFESRNGEISNLSYYLRLETEEKLINKLLRRTINIESTSGEYDGVYDSIEDFINIEELGNDISLIYVTPLPDIIDIHELSLSSKLSNKVTYKLKLKDYFLYLKTPEKTYLVAMESSEDALRSLLKSGYTYIKKDGDFEIYYKRDH